MSVSQVLQNAICFCAVLLVYSLPLFAASREVIIDNPKVRVLHLVLEPGEDAEIDNQKLDRVVVWLQSGSAETRRPGGETGTTSWKQNEAQWETANSSYLIRLKGSVPVAEIVVEVKGKGDSQRANTSPQNPWIVDPKHYKIEFENRDVRVTRVKIGPKESTPLHEHSLDRVVIYLTPLDFQIDPEGKPSEHSVQKAGAVVWGAPARHTEHNLSDKGFEAIVVEPKY